MAPVTVQNLSYRYPHTRGLALRDVSLSIEEGEFLAIVGPNGAGKSTLCYALTAFIPHFFQGDIRGSVSVFGQDTADHTLEEMMLVAGLVFQNPANQITGARFTVYEEIAFGLENLGVPRQEMRERIDHILEVTHISDLADRSPYSLSGGQQQRVVLASILVMEPRLLILDEPTSQLDPIGSREVFEVIRAMNHRGITVVMVEHKLEWVAAFADRVAVMLEGQIALEGAPQAVLTSDLVVERVGQTDFTAAARRAKAMNLWHDGEPMPVTLDEAASSFGKMTFASRKP